MDNKRKIRSDVIAKYSNMLLEIAAADNFRTADVCNKYKISQCFSAILLSLNIVVKNSDGSFHWVGMDPDAVLVNNLIERVKMHNLAMREPALPSQPAPPLKLEDPPKPVQTRIPPPSVPKKVSPGMIEAAAMAAELAVKLGKKDIRAFVQGVLMAD